MMATQATKRIAEAIKQLEAAIQRDKAAGKATDQMEDIVLQIQEACKALDDHLKE